MDWIVSLVMLLGGLFALLAAVGILRLPDLYTRMQAAAKGGTLGAGLLILSVVIHFNDLGVAVRGTLVIVFLFLTAPIAAHMIGRAAYFVGYPPWEGTKVDELQGHYDPKSPALSSQPLPQGISPKEDEAR